MLTRTKFFLLLFVLNCPPSLLIPLPQEDVASISNTNNSVVLGPNQFEQITPNNLQVRELLQQIDVKDSENHVISNINNVVISDENIQNDNNETQNNGTNNVVVKNALEQTGNVSSVLNTTGVTNPLNDSSPLLLINSSGKPLKGDNITIQVQGLQNKLANETQTNLLSTINNASFINATGVPTLESIDGENTLHESLNDAEVELAWRSEIPVGNSKAKNLKHIAQLDSQNATLLANNINRNINNNNSDLLDSENNEEKSIFVILNSGNIDGLSVNSSANNGHLQTNVENNTIENLNSKNTKLLNDLINSTINDVLSKILKPNRSNLHSTQRIFLLLNSGNISNVHISSPVLENIVKNAISKERSRRHLNESYTNNTNIGSVTLKPSTDALNPTIDIKFRIGEHQGAQNNVTKENHVATVPLDNNQYNSVLLSNAPDNAFLADSNATNVVNPDEDISSAEAPAFRSLIPDKVRKLQEVSNIINSELNKTKNHNLVLKLSPESSPISIDLNQIPINNILGGALSFIKIFKKRSTNVEAENIYPWKTNCISKQIDEHHIITTCKKPKLNDNDLTIPTRKSLDDDISNVLKLYDSVDLVCPLSVIVKLYAHRVLDNISSNDPDSILNKILISFVKGNKDAINLATNELSNLPVPVKIRLQLVHGKTKEFMEQLSDFVDAMLCSLS